MKLSHQKLKMMYLAKILLDKTDEEHTITVPEMIAELAKLGISAERKSIYDDLEYLQLYGLDICSNKTRTTNYYIASRDFELPELKLLVDSVQASKFITRKKSMELISKIEKLTSHENAKKLQRQVFITNRVKTLNEQIYYNVDKIHEAIAANKQITFKYYILDVNKKKVYRKDGGLYTESPVSLTWDDENYYLITYKEKYDSYTHYRVDKMENIELMEEDRVLSDKPFDLSHYSKTMFQMFSGEETDVSIEFD
ncbi:MAG: WYL domain-containing protein, partial [Clostridia bacterium]|nr:WYL domain-containing protein [Clostridia bacterium]